MTRFLLPTRSLASSHAPGCFIPPRNSTLRNSTMKLGQWRVMMKRRIHDPHKNPDQPPQPIPRRSTRITAMKRWPRGRQPRGAGLTTRPRSQHLLSPLCLPCRVDAQGLSHRQLVLHSTDPAPAGARTAQQIVEVAGKGAKRSRRTASLRYLPIQRTQPQSRRFHNWPLSTSAFWQWSSGFAILR